MIQSVPPSAPEPPKLPPALMTVKEASRYTGLSERELYRRMNDGELERVYFGRALRITTLSIHQMIEAHKHGGRQ